MYKIIGGDKKEYGPVPVEELRVWLREGRVNRQTSAQPATGGEWRPLVSYPEFASEFAAGTRPPPLVGQPQPKSYLWLAIVCTLCWCPLAIPAWIFAVNVQRKFAAGDISGAESASRNARLWCWIAFVGGAVFHVIEILLVKNVWRINVPGSN